MARRIIYQKTEHQCKQENIETVAKLFAATLDDATAATVPYLFPKWQGEQAYPEGTRLHDGHGKLYRTKGAHTSQTAAPMSADLEQYEEVT